MTSNEINNFVITDDGVWRSNGIFKFRNMAKKLSIKFLRSTSIASNYEAASTKLSGLNLSYGEPAVVKYYEGAEEDGNIRLLLGIGYQQGTGNAVLEVASFESVQDVKDAVTALGTKVGDLNDIKEGVAKTSIVAAINSLKGQIQSAVSRGVTSVVAGQGVSVDAADVNNPKVSVKLDPAAGNAATLSDAGLKVTIPVSAEYSITKDSDSGDVAAIYHLTKNGSNVGAAITIPKDLVVKSGSVIVITEENKDQFTGVEPAVEVGDQVLQLVLTNNEKININVKSLIDIYTAGAYITITGNTVAVNYESLKTQLTTDLNVGDISTIRTDVNTLKTTVGNSTSGLVKDVNTLKGDKTTEGSVAKAIEDLKSAILGTATEDYDTLGEVETKIKDLQSSLSTLDGEVLKSIEAAGIATVSSKADGKQTITVNSEINDSAAGTVTNKTYSAKKITDIVSAFNIKSANSGTATTVTVESNTLKVNVVTDGSSIDIDDSGKLAVSTIDGGSF